MPFVFPPGAEIDPGEAKRARMRRLSRLAIVSGIVLAVLVFVVTAVVYTGSERALAAPAQTADGFSAAGGDASHGGHLAVVLGCTNCHGADLGGAAMPLDASIATLWAPNLTTGAGGVGGEYTDGDYEWALRHGVRHGGGAMIVMPSSSYAALSDADLRDLVAYLHTIPPVERSVPARSLGPLGRVLLATGRLTPETTAIASGLPPLATSPSSPVELGHYLSAVGGCMHCHGASLGGGHADDPKAPPAPDLTPSGAAANWTPEQFASTLREGQAPDGHFLNAAMPWRPIGQMTDAELGALQAYFQSLAPAHPAAP